MKHFAAFLAVVASAGMALGAITGSQHDFSGNAWSGGQKCLPCHTPHNALSTLAPLWNHATTAATFTIYTSTSMNATTGQPSGMSKACLSCHDGTVAVDNYGTRTPTPVYVTGTALLGTDLSNDHPVSFTYDSALVADDGGLAATSAPSGIGTKTIAQAMLFGGKMECASCHDVHNAYSLSNLLKKDNAGSALCLTCHTK